MSGGGSGSGKAPSAEDIQRQIDELDAQRRALEEQMQALREQRTALETERTNLAEERASLTEQSEQVARERGELEQRETALNERSDAISHQETELHSREEQLASDRADLDRERADISNQIAAGVASQNTARTQAELSNLERDLTDPASRPRVLKVKFVDEYRGQKEQEHRELERDLAGGAAPAAPGGPPDLSRVPVPAAGAAPAQQDTGGITAEGVNDLLSDLSSAGGYLNAGWSMIDGFLNTESATEDHMTQVDRYVNSSFALGNAGLSGAQNISQFVVNRKKRNATKDKAKKANLTWNSLGNALSLTGSLASGTNAIIGYSTDLKQRQKDLDEKNAAKKEGEEKEHDDVLRASSWMSGISAGLSFLGSASKAVGNIHEVVANKRIAKNLEKERVKDNNDILEDTLKNDLTTVLTSQGGNKASAAYQRQLKLHKSFKARKYGMEQMRQFRENKGKRLPKGIISAVGSSVSMASSFANIFNDGYKKSTWGKRLRGFMPAIGKAAGMIDKYVGKQTDKNIAEGSENIKVGEIDKYLNKKRSKVQKDINEKFNMPAHVDFQMGNNELDRITLGRLGVDIKIVNDPISKEEKLKAFEQLNLKRAKQIMAADDTREILTAMGLNEDANLEEVAAALKGE